MFDHGESSQTIGIRWAPTLALHFQGQSEVSTESINNLQSTSRQQKVHVIGSERTSALTSALTTLLKLLQLLLCYLFRVHQIPQVESKFRAKMPVRCFTPYCILATAANTLHRAFLSSTIQLLWAISTDGLISHTKYHAPKSNSLFSVSWTRHIFRLSGKWPGIMLYVSSSRLQNTLAFLLLLSVRKNQF